MAENEDAYNIAQKSITYEGVKVESVLSAMRLYRIPIDDRPVIADKVFFMAGKFLSARKKVDEIKRAEKEQKQNTKIIRKR